MIDNDLREKERETLSKIDNLTFYYSRKDRLDRMPEHKKLYNGELSKRKGFFQALAGTKQNRFLLVTIVFFMAAVMIMTQLTDTSDEIIFEGVPVKLSAFAYDDTVYVIITFDKRNEFTESLQVQLSVGTYDNKGTLVDSKLLLSSYTGNEEQVKTTFVDANISEVLAVLRSSSGEEKNISASVDRE